MEYGVVLQRRIVVQWWAGETMESLQRLWSRAEEEEEEATARDHGSRSANCIGKTKTNPPKRHAASSSYKYEKKPKTNIQHRNLLATNPQFPHTTQIKSSRQLGTDKPKTSSRTQNRSRDYRQRDLISTNRPKIPSPSSRTEGKERSNQRLMQEPLRFQWAGSGSSKRTAPKWPSRRSRVAIIS